MARKLTLLQFTCSSVYLYLEVNNFVKIKGELNKKKKNPQRKDAFQKNEIVNSVMQARIQRGGAGGARPPVFVPNSLKRPLNWPKYA